ncbi:uncharacterized protein LOC143568200 [Bidens hawaiensis]|uniref:uncharacterized protein LOC143568200 n=1 Tax=Bidens hawaiensis TaxID=980011 RepID=UPI004049362C
MDAIHPALIVNNIRNFILLILDLENRQYTSWVELFTIHCTVFEVLDQIIPSDVSSYANDKEKDNDTAAPVVLASWDRLDAVVKQWIYSTISQNLLMNVIKPKATAK